MPNPMHTKPERGGLERAGRIVVRAAVVPGCDRLLARTAALVLRPSRGDRLTVTDAPGARDLVRHALIDLGGNGNRLRSWAKAAKRWPRGAQKDLLDAYPAMDFPVLLLWADEDAVAPARDRRGGARPVPGRPVARPPAHRLPDRLRRSGRCRARALAFCG